ncbi:DUF6807 family protein [Microbacterium sp. G2-8]|uniref:DUF6807 family protein n=1 Tax=Microbacterium sp. G2-8 TaxID=2842454 RepID=UPI001C89288D|nr:DUF6807 family protein [Microbacterium sp. G2-8]
MSAGATLRLVDGTIIAQLNTGSDVEPSLSPRPSLTATTRAGVPVTDVSPADHAHHLGASLALPDVDGVSFWGGRTYVRDRGSTMLDNHGRQVERSVDSRDDSSASLLDWVAPDGTTLLTEQRDLAVTERDGAWALEWRSRLLAGAADVTLGSPQTNGRDGAFYGGLFWRTPFAEAEVRTADGVGVTRAHGSRSPWLILESAHATLVAVTRTGMPWFVRTEGYVGFGPAVAVSERRRIPSGGTLDLDLSVGVLDAADAAQADDVRDWLLDARLPQEVAS